MVSERERLAARTIRELTDRYTDLLNVMAEMQRALGDDLPDQYLITGQSLVTTARQVADRIEDA